MEVWQFVETGWLVPTKIVNGETTIKPTSDWNFEERKTASRNFTTLHAIQCSMDDKMVGLIASSGSAKDA